MKIHKFATFLLTLFIFSQAFAFDWKPQSNESLRADMMSYAQDAAARAKGTPAGKEIKRFLRKVKKYEKENPYAWVDDTRALVRRLEALCPPCEDDGSDKAQIRRDILRLIDFPLHLNNYDNTAPAEQAQAFDSVSAIYRSEARAKALAWLDGPAPKPGELELVKVYNLGYFIRTSARTIAVDVKWEGTAEEAAAIAEKVEIFFLSHPHKDHYDDVLMQALAAAGKAMVLPSDVIPHKKWSGKTVVNDDITVPENVCGIDMQVIRGDQGPGIPNNGYILSFDGWRLLLQGENSHPKIEEAFSQFDSPDLILAPSWNGINHLFEVVSKMPGYNRDSVRFIPGHENEVNHTVDHRESYRELFTRKDRLGDPDIKYPRVILLDIGEAVSLRR